MYNGTSIGVKGVAQVEVSYGNQMYHLPLVIARQENGASMPALLGRDWLVKIKIDLHDAVQNLREVVLNVQAVRNTETEKA